MGNQGPAGVLGRWTSYREFSFPADKADLSSSEKAKAADVATYMKANPSLLVGIDGSTDPRGTDPRSQQLTDSRVDAVRTALVNAGVPASRIKTGAFAEPGLAKDRQVSVLLITAD